MSTGKTDSKETISSFFSSPHISSDNTGSHCSLGGLKNEFSMKRVFLLKASLGTLSYALGLFKTCNCYRLLPVVTGLCSERNIRNFVLIPHCLCGPAPADFTGGIDITIGMSECLGINFPKISKDRTFEKHSGILETLAYFNELGLETMCSTLSPYPLSL